MILSKTYVEGFVTCVFGPCSVESPDQIEVSAAINGRVKRIVEPFSIDIKQRGSCWKPRTRLYNGSDKVFEGTLEVGLGWLANAARKNNLEVVTEVMATEDLRYFRRLLDPKQDYIQIGARNSQNFGMLFDVGGHEFGMVVKNPQHGFRPDEGLGSVERKLHNREVVYCVRGFTATSPAGEDSSLHHQLMSVFYQNPHVFPEARNLNNIESIRQIRDDIGLRQHEIKVWYDPSHIFGGNSDEMRRKIGEYAIMAVTKFGYDGIIVEVHDTSRYAKTDANQALLSTTNGIDWSKTFVKKKPDLIPLTLVDIVTALIKHQVERSAVAVPASEVNEAIAELDSIKWNNGA